MEAAQTVSPSARIALAAFVACVYAAAAYALTRTSPVAPYAVFAILAAPVAAYLAFVRPLVFPFGLYVLLVPFDNLLVQGQFGTLTKLLGIVSGACLLLWLLRHNAISLRGKPLAALGLLAVWMLLTTAWALDQQTAEAILLTYGGLMLLYATLAMMPASRRQLDALFALIALGGIAAAAYGAFLFYTNPSYALVANFRLIVQGASTIIDPNHFAAAMLFPALIVAMWSLRTKRLTLKILGFACFALIAFAILLSGSRGGFVALALGLLYFLARSRYRVQLIAMLLVLSSSLAGAKTSIWMRFAHTIETGGSGRTSIWSVGAEAAKHRPIEGYGIGNFSQAYDLFYINVHQTYPYGFSSPAHNIVLHYLVELGIVGLLLLGWFYVAQFRSLRHIGRDDPLYDYRIVMEGALVAIGAMSLTIDLFTYKYAWLVFAAVAMLASAVPRRYASAEIRPASAAMIPARSARS